MDYQQMIADLKKKGASDLHLESGLVPTARIQGDLKPLGKDPLEAAETQKIAQDLLSKTEWESFINRKAIDLSTVLGGVRCRINIMKTIRGVGLAIRLLSNFQPTLDRLNLHPDLGKLVKNSHGLLVVSGPTGSGKSSTLAALIHEINVRESLHIVTIESPIEYTLLPRRAFIRQREVGRDTPSFEQALLDAMRQDPDVIMVGEMRDRETIRLTLNAAETGQLVLSTLHASNTSEAVQRMVAAFPPEIQGSVCAQLADSFIAIVAQRLGFNEDFGIRVPLCEILLATHPIKNLIRQGQFFKLPSALETGHSEGNWTFRRYQAWLDHRSDFFIPTGTESLDASPQKNERPLDPLLTEKRELKSTEKGPETEDHVATKREGSFSEDVIVIEEPEEESLSDLLEKLDDRKKDSSSPQKRKGKPKKRKNS